ncbi:uncharacterized protein Tco025E_02843 [Trypanosoma conorhini]|uniref:Uncharacterized protein n=1 Tax=Trypanosoma conorhini TaxID=83891 RepID=A0A422Q0U5_9TRYP|nr:uncharacterized protein Tco025E_02843 [Trypanosoma conorhini]RNF23621.1 hypothetical protein Tco025E_02843 [Trypanosoma conorhini]
MGTKRQREEGEDGSEKCRVYFSYGDWNALVTLYRPLAFDTLDPETFPGLTFFFAPRVVGVMNGHYVLSLNGVNRPCDHLLRQRPWLPCSYHGPFRCSCHALEQIARGVRQLERELTFLPRRLALRVTKAGKHETAPFIYMDNLTRAATICLCGLPLPQTVLGPMTLCLLDDEYSIARAISSAFSESHRKMNAGTKCVLCAAETDRTCSVCGCWVCAKCDIQCCSCGKNACKACVVNIEEIPTKEEEYCLNCYSL